MRELFSVSDVKRWNVSLYVVILWIADAMVRLFTAPLVSMLGTYAVLIGALLGILVVGPLRMGFTYVSLLIIQDQPYSFRNMLQGFKNNYVAVVLAPLLTALIVMAGFIVFILPGIYFMIRLIYVNFLVMDKNMNAVDAVKESWRMSKGQSWDILRMMLWSVCIFILGVLCLLIGIFPASVVIALAFARLYTQRL